MAVGTGFGVDLSVLDKAFEEADKHLKAISDKTSGLQKDTIDAFRQMTNKGVVPYIESLKQQIKMYEALGKAAEKGGMTTIKTEATAAVDELNKVVDALQKVYKKEYSGRGAISFSNRVLSGRGEVKSIDNMRLALQQLEEAQSRQNLSTKRGRENFEKIGHSITKVKSELNKLNEEGEKTKTSFTTVGNVLSVVFSAQAIRGYVNNLIKVRGEFELQQRSLQALLQSKDDADRLWQQTIDLAVKSPFRISELVSYTKQLAAYQIESEKLFETNKMLADVSAGLGVDMQRLILAFGQVKAANFLRGTELRQFTEAGVPMLEELAKHFSELEGTAVSVGDVFERISKRMVSFSDVEAVFRNITSAGGDFYRMQEIQSETLKGQIRNLKDSIDLMLNSIGKSTDSALKWGVGAIKSLVDNWQLVTKSIEGVIAALAIYKLQAALVSKSMIALANTLGVINDEAATQITLQQLLKVGWRSLINPIKNAASAMYNFAAAHPVLLAVTVAIAGLLKILRQWNTVNANIENFVKKLDEAKTAANELSVAFQFGDTSEQRSSLLSLIGLANREYKMKIALDAESIKNMDTRELEAKFVEIREAIFDANAFAYSFAEAMEKDAFKQWLGNLIDDDVFEDIDDFGKRAEQLDAQVRNSMKSIVASVLDSGVTLDDYQKQLLESLTIPKDVNESNYRYVERLEEAFKGLSGVFKAAGVDVDETEKAFRRFGRATKEVEKEFKDFVKGFKISSELSDEQKAYQLKFAIDKLGFEKEWGEFERDLLYRLAEEEYNVTIGIQSDTSAQTLEPWANRVYDAITKVNEKIKKENPDFKGGLFPLPQVGQTKEQYVAAAKAVIDVAKATYNDIQQIEEDSTVQRTKALSPYVTEVEKILNLFKDSGRDGGRDEVLEKLKNRINLIKEMNKEYEKLNKTFSKTESLAKVQKAYADTAKELGLDTSTMDFTDEGTIKSLEALLGKPEYAANKYVIELQKALDNFKVELGVEVKQERDKDLKAQVQELFDQYDLSLELKKLNIPKDLAKSLFDVDYLDLDGLKKKVQDQEAKFIGTDMEDEYKKFLEKIDDMEDKAAKERMKTYVKYLQEGMSERVKLKIEELRKLKEIEESDEFTPEQKERIKAGVSKEAKKAQDKQEWKDFQGSEMYTMMFEDLEFLGTKALDILQKKLEDLKGSLSDLDASEVKEIIGQINKIEDVMIGRNPFKYMKVLKDELKNMKSEEEYQIDLINAQKQEEDAQSVIDAIHTVQQAKVELGEVEAYKSVDKETLQIYLQMSAEAIKQGRTLEDIVKDKEAIVKTSQKEGQIAAQGLNTYKKVDKTLEQQIASWQEIGGKINEVFDASKELMTTLGADTDGVAMSLVESGQAMTSLIVSAITFGKQMKVLGYESNMALGVIGWVAIGVQAVATALSAIFSAKDKALQKTVEDNLATVERLQKKYETLEDAIDGAWSTAAIQQYNKELQATTQSMIASQKAAIAAQQQRKGANEKGSDAYNKLQEMKAELAEMENQLAESLEESFSKVTDGILDSVHDAAKEFTDAWYEAYAETGDGLKGLEENFNEMFLTLAKNQAAMQITGAFAERWKKDLEKYINADDTELTKDEAKKWAEEVRRTMPELSAALEAFLGTIHEGLDMGGGKLSALQKGIQGITEDTAQVLESLLNSMRFYVADSNTELKNQTKYMRDIYNMLSGMTTAHSQGGRGIKVVM